MSNASAVALITLTSEFEYEYSVRSLATYMPDRTSRVLVCSSRFPCAGREA